MIITSHKDFPQHIERLRKHIRVYSRLPHSNKILSGKVLEKVAADAVNGHASDDNSFIDVVKDNTGWQLKSTMQSTKHLVWGRVKVDDKYERILEACESEALRDELGSDLLRICNEKMRSSMEKHGVEELRYMHVKFMEGNTVHVTEAILQPNVLFNEMDFLWEWQNSEDNTGALVGYHADTGEEWFRWYGQNENHFHLTNERAWLEEMAIRTNHYEFHINSTQKRLPLELFEVVVNSAAKELFKKAS